MPNLKKLWLLVVGLQVQLLTFAQQTSTTTVQDDNIAMNDGKIYVVMTVVITILAGLLIYVARLDKKLTRLEKGKF